MEKKLVELVVSALEFPCYYDEGSQMIYDQQGKFVLDVRGWGWIQKLGDQPYAIQDAWGKAIADKINEFNKKQ